MPVTTETVQFAEVTGVPLLADAYVPDTTDANRAAIVLVHGGSWSGGTRMSFGAEAEWLAQLGFVTFTIDYRLAPQFPYPAGVADVRRFVRWLRAPAQVVRFRIDPARVGAFGSSAGGHLAAMLGTVGKGPLTRGSRVQAVVSWSGPMDLTDVHAVIGGEAVRTFLGCEPADTPACAAKAEAASPAHRVDPSDAPTLLFNSDEEVVPLTQAEAMDAALSSAGVEHALVVYPGDAHGGSFRVDAWPQTVAFFEHHLGAPRAG